MDIFRFFKKSPAAGSSSGAKPRPLIPTVAPDAGLFVAYDEIFFKEMATIKALTNIEIRKIHAIVTNGEGQHLNQGRYHGRVFDEFFKGKTWRWPEYDTWNLIFTKCGAYPVGWCDFTTPREAMPFSEEIGMLKVSQLKDLLSAANIYYPERAKKKYLIAAALATPNAGEVIPKLPLWSNIREGLFESDGYGLYTLLMRTIMFRAKSYHDRIRHTKLGFTKRTLVIRHASDRKFAEMALSANPDALTPLYPSDVSFWKVEVAGF